MPKYTPPNPGAFYDIKLIRVEGDFFSTVAGDQSTLHTTLAEQEEITARIRELRETNPTQVDGLKVSFLGVMAVANGDSDTLELPVDAEAREITLQKLREQTPGFTIKARPGYTVYEGQKNSQAERL